MRIDGRLFNIHMPEQLHYPVDIHPFFMQVGGKGMAEGVGRLIFPR
jgi:hypothetical protein